MFPPARPSENTPVAACRRFRAGAPASWDSSTPATAASASAPRSAPSAHRPATIRPRHPHHVPDALRPRTASAAWESSRLRQSGNRLRSYRSATPTGVCRFQF
ncbi:uncharacterized protein LOC142802871 isoform X2 [Rhipicephalus microplus]|uniref:uncharacterized protein LOC142802871 isoform X2 n=1 Tax=Rhipicephalus microplus TaxID=6941 RepID=UPI003F6B8BB4